MSQAPTNPMRKKLFGLVFTLIIIVAGAILFNLFSTAVINGEYWQSKANSQQMDSFTINANRGTIYDRNMNVLAKSLTVWDVIVEPYVIMRDSEAYEVKRTTQVEKNYEAAMAEYEEAVEAGTSAEKPKKEIVYSEAHEISLALSEILGMDYDELMEICTDDSLRYANVKLKIEKAEADLIEQFMLEKNIGTHSLYLTPNTKRYYPKDSLAASVIGFVNYDNNGEYGIEAYYDDYLQGVDGRIVRATDNAGGAMPYYEYEMYYEAQNGNSLVLTVDEVLQHFLEKNLETAVSQHKADNRATGIIMNAKTGAILAMATSPGFDLNDRGELSASDNAKLDQMRVDLVNQALIMKGFAVGTEDDLTEEEIAAIDKEINQTYVVMRETQWKNKAISELYYPGSVFKVITCASALEEQVVNLNSTFSCGGFVMFGETKISCWTSAGHGVLSLVEAITKSCNPAFMNIGERLGANTFSDYLEAFGFTQKTGIDLPGEAQSIYMHREGMGTVELASSSFGQTNKITPLQMITAYAATINGGYLVTPYVVEKILDNEGNVIKSTETNIKRQVISEETSAQMRSILEQVVEYNGGSNAYISGYRIGGKSGTSQKIDEYSMENMRYVSSFAAFTPADDPEIIMLVCVDEPLGTQYYGSAVAAPVVSSVFKECLNYLEIYQQFTAEELALQDTIVPYVLNKSLLDAKTELNNAGLDFTIVGEESGSTVDSTTPAAGQPISKNGTVVVYLSEETEKVYSTVPSVIGMNAADANAALTNAGLNVILSGGAVFNQNSRAIIQSIDPGTVVASGTVVEVAFIIDDETG